ncbi:phosphatase PAP2 family protein [Rufibacter radiotolerans]|uniref:phosphatase PAP2 family protein n=1 Tax=Rufibacter radiotolerans TaxID=1379910 RepID=UPI0006646852|nr:phosphatase PAP2 family protein [Rufibacter radiotolerans]
MRPLLLLFALLFTVSATHASVPFLPTSPPEVSDTTLHQLAPNRTWVKKHHTLLVGAASAIAVTGFFIGSYQQYDRPIMTFAQQHRNAFTNETARLVQPLGTALPLHATFATMFTIGAVARRPKLREAAVVGLASFYVNALVTDQLKKNFQRYRPCVTQDSHLFDGASGAGQNTSLPSSHTSNAFAAASVISSVYHDSEWVPPVAYGVATLVGLSRINDNKHWASDVLAGATIGYLTGKATYWGYQRLKGHLSGPRIQLTPAWQNGSPGMAAFVRF